MSENEHAYRVDLKWNEGRLGTLSVPGFSEQLKVATPPPFPGGMEGKWSPEHLLAAAVSSCFMTTFAAIAEYSKLAFEDLEVNAVCHLDKVDGKLLVSRVEMDAQLVIADAESTDKARRIMEKAESACLISRSVKAKVIFRPHVRVAALG